VAAELAERAREAEEAAAASGKKAAKKDKPAAAAAPAKGGKEERKADKKGAKDSAAAAPAAPVTIVTLRTEAAAGVIAARDEAARCVGAGCRLARSGSHDCLLRTATCGARRLPRPRVCGARRPGAWARSKAGAVTSSRSWPSGSAESLSLLFAKSQSVTVICTQKMRKNNV
jgi:hypothetical protein